jgi:hypothetical protein
MSELIATTVVKNKFWVVEAQGEKIATIQAREDGGFVYVHDDRREYFPSTKHLKQQLNIKFSGTLKKKTEENNTVYGYPIKGRSYNQVYDVVRRLPVYSNTPKSKSLFCAGYYLVKLNNHWVSAFCPKNITLNRYNFIGPFKTEQEVIILLKEKNAGT